MAADPKTLELLSPAKNADFGIEAINHGADAVYIGGPAFGARAAAGNTVSDIARLAAHAHRFDARVYVAINTILRDDELEPARQLAWQVYEAGADALIVQDMGLLELDLPPLALHASTQMDNRTPAKVRFLEQVGFSQVVLARELSLDQIRGIAEQTGATLEFFVHGALCVSYSGQCYLSHAQTGRSANRGECSQACRLPYSLSDTDGTVIASAQHLLSLKDNNQSANLGALIDAGIRSFKIEGRLKDLAYVKNVTAYYRQQLDALLAERPECRRASAGRCQYTFVPQPEKTFNRGATDYFVNGRTADIGAFRTPKFAGDRIGEVVRVGRDHVDVTSRVPLHNGDGLSFFDDANTLTGLRINRVEARADGQRLFPAERQHHLRAGTVLYRNRDQSFEALLDKKSAERRIGITLCFRETATGFALEVTDEQGIHACSTIDIDKTVAQHTGRTDATIREQLAKLGATHFFADHIDIALSADWFVPASLLNTLRRDAIALLESTRAAAWRRPLRATAVSPAPAYPETELSYLGNVFNDKARAFYARHGVQLIADAYECGRETGLVSLMITKHCLRYSFNLCPKQVKGIRPDPMTLLSDGEPLSLRFDCKRCEMHVLGKLKKARTVTMVPQRRRQG